MRIFGTLQIEGGIVENIARYSQAFGADIRQPFLASTLGARNRTHGFSSHLAERVGFEPTVPEGTAVFETAPFVHSGTSPGLLIGLQVMSKSSELWPIAQLKINY